MKLLGKVAIVTGSPRGIGKAIAKAFAQEGAKVVICGTTIEHAMTTSQELQNELSLPQDNFLPVGLDMKDTNSIINLVETTINKWQKIDILVNNAGITATKSLLDSTDADFSNMYDINVLGLLKTTREVVKYMKNTSLTAGNS